MLESQIHQQVPRTDNGHTQTPTHKSTYRHYQKHHLQVSWLTIASNLYNITSMT